MSLSTVPVPITVLPLLNVTVLPIAPSVPRTNADMFTGLFTFTVDGSKATLTSATTGVGSLTLNVTAVLFMLSQVAVILYVPVADGS